MDDRSQNESGGRTTHALAEVVRFLQVVRHRLRLLTMCVAAGGLLGGLWYSIATRKYESSAEILVLKTEGGAMDSGNSNGSNSRAILDVMPTYQKVLTSDVVLEGAIKSLPNKYRGDFRGQKKAKWTKILRDNMTVSSTRMTNVLNVRYVSTSPESAARVVGAVVDSYLTFMRQTHHSSSKEALDVLTKEKANIEQSMNEKEQELLKVQERAGVLLMGDDKNMNVLIERTVKLNEALIEAQKKTLDARALLAAVDQALAGGSDLSLLAQQLTGTLYNDFALRIMGISSSDTYSVARFEQRLQECRSELRNKMASYGPNHPRVRALEDEITSVERWFSERPRVVAESTRSIQENEMAPRLREMAVQTLFQAQAREDATRAEFDIEIALATVQNNEMVNLEILELDVKRMRSFYELVLDQMKKIDMGSDAGLKISVVSVPRIPLSKCAPKISTTILLCLFLGTVVGLGLIYISDTLDDRFRSPDELQWQLGLPMLAMIRRMEPLQGTGIDSIVTHVKRDGIEAESFRTLRSSITFSNEDTTRLVVTSTEPGDGKTTTLANLAVAFAQAGKKTLLIDADMRRPGMTQMLEMKGPRGLSQVLREDRPVADSCLENVFHLGVEGLDFMPSGARPANPSELLSSERFSDIIAWGEQIYDQILIDAPPVLAVTDPAIIGRVVDGAVIVIRPDKNRRKMVTRAVDSFRATGAKVIGIVANHLQTGAGTDYGYGYGYGYGHGYGHEDAPETGSDTPGVAAEPELRRAA